MLLATSVSMSLIGPDDLAELRVAHVRMDLDGVSDARDRCGGPEQLTGSPPITAPWL